MKRYSRARDTSMGSSLYPGHTPTYYAAVTDAYIVYPWELDRGPEALGMWN